LTEIEISEYPGIVLWLGSWEFGGLAADECAHDLKVEIRMTAPLSMRGINAYREL
jgi:hypothetical protein